MSNSKQKIKSNLSGFWRLAKAKMDAADTSTLNEAKSYVDGQISSLETFSQEVVDELPVTGEPKVLYFVPAEGGEGSNVYNEFIWVNAKGQEGQEGYKPAHFEQVGSTEYTPDHSVEDYDDDQHLKITIGNTSYIIPRVELVKPPTPTYTPSGTSFDGTTQITLMCIDGGQPVAGAEIFYTTNGDTPTKNSTKYTSPIELAQDPSMQTKTYTIKAIAILNGVSSNVLTASIGINRQVEKPVISPSSSTNRNTQASVTITCDTDGATIRYTTNGSDVTSESAVYSGAITVDSTTTVKAKAFKTDWAESEQSSKSYTFKVDDPSIVIGGNAYSDTRTVTISKPTGATFVKWRKKKENNGTWSDYETIVFDSGETTKQVDTLNERGTYYIEAVAEHSGWTSGEKKNVNGEVKKRYVHILMTDTTDTPSESSIESAASAFSERSNDPSGKQVTFNNSSSSGKQMWVCVPNGKTITKITNQQGWTQPLTEATTTNYNLYCIGQGIAESTSVTYNINPAN